MTEPGTGPPQPHTGPRPPEPPQGAGPCPGGGEGMPQRGRRDSGGGGARRGLSKCLRGHPWRSRAKNLPADAEAQVQPQEVSTCCGVAKSPCATTAAAARARALQKEPPQ